jgi:Ca-activated chloride channel family protein
MAPIFQRAEKELGISVVLTQQGSVEGARLISQPATREGYDAVWFASDQFFGIWPGSRQALAEQSPPLMRSPVVLGLHSQVLDTLGWGQSVSWTTILGAVRNGKLRYAMTRPDYSNSGLATLVGLATALANTGAPVSMVDVPGRLQQLRAFFVGNRLKAESSRWLADRYLEQFKPGQACSRSAQADGVDGLFTYESEVLRLQSERPEGCLVPVYPAEGTIVADYRLTLLQGATGLTRGTFEDLWHWLYSEPIQRLIEQQTRRRPGNPHVEEDRGATPVAQLRYPTDPAVVKRLIDVYREELRSPSRMVFVLDVSGSMRDSMPVLRDAFVRLTGSDPADPSTYFSFMPGERVELLPFESKPGTPRLFVLPTTDTGPVLAAIRGYAQDLKVGQETALYASLEQALRTTQQWLAEPVAAGEPAPHTSIVVFSDGQNTCGPNYTDYQAFRRDSLSDAGQKVPIYTIVFGDRDSGGQCPDYRPDSGPPADPNHPGETQWQRELRVIAEQSGGLSFPANADDLYQVFWSIRGYQ